MADVRPTLRASRMRQWLHILVTYDVFPEFSARVRRFVYNPLGILTLAALASLVCGLFLRSYGFVLCGGILAVVALGVIWPWLTLRGLVATVAFDRIRATEGETCQVRLTLHNLLPWPAWGLAVRGGFGGGPSDVVVGISTIPGRRTVLCRWAFTPPCRGIYPLATAKLTTGFPFGLWENCREIKVDAPLIVWPRTFPVGPIPPASGDRQVDGHVSGRKVGNNGDVLGVRPYRRGDSPRRIHWGQTARHDRLIVCELQSNFRPVVQIVLDADPLVHVGHGAESSREWAIRVVASFVKGWLAEGAEVELVWDSNYIAAGGGQTQMHKILDTLAGIAPSCDKAIAQVLASPLCQGCSDRLQVIVTTDRGFAAQRHVMCQMGDRRWVVLKATAFGESEGTNSGESCLAAWLWIDSVGAVPALLRGGWKEARHGS